MHKTATKVKCKIPARYFMEQNQQTAGLERERLTRSRFSLFISVPKAVSHKGERNMLAWANYRGFHVANVLSDPPSPQSLMETGDRALRAFTSDMVSSDKEQGVCER